MKKKLGSKETFKLGKVAPAGASIGDIHLRAPLTPAPLAAEHCRGTPLAQFPLHHVPVHRVCPAGQSARVRRTHVAVRGQLPFGCHSDSILGLEQRRDLELLEPLAAFVRQCRTPLTQAPH